MVYFIYNSTWNVMKIGYSAEPEKRLKQIQTACPMPLILRGVISGDKVTESRWHAKYAPCRLEGEWFRADAGMLREIDQAIGAPLKLWGCAVTDVYLAGKVTRCHWRDQILGHGRKDLLVYPTDDWIVRNCVSIPMDTRRLTYRGPFWLDPWGGHRDNPGAHAFGDLDGVEHCNQIETNAILVRDRCFDGVSNSQLVFAWIDSSDCYGTIAEIAFAKGLRRDRETPIPLIAIATPNRSLIEEMWFVFSMADHVHCSDSPGNAWESLWVGNYISPTYKASHPNVIRSLEDEDEDEDEDETNVECFDFHWLDHLEDERAQES